MTKALAQIEFESPRRGAARFRAQAKLPSDDGAHPLGQWSVHVEVWAEAGDTVWGSIELLSEEAPRDELVPGLSFELYAGPKRLARATVLEVRRDDGPLGRERDFLAGVSEPLREADAA